MEGTMFQSAVPFRPIPVYGQLLSGGPVRIPPPQDSPSPSKCHTDSFTLTKHLNLLSHMNHIRALGDFPFGQLTRSGTSSHNTVLQDMNKFSVKNLGLSLGSERYHAMAHGQKVLADERSKAAELHQSDPHPKNVVVRNTENVETKNKVALFDRMQVPVMLSCGAPFASQYGYGRKVFPCPQCRYTTDRRNNLKRHMLTMHQTCTKTLECCGIMFATKASLREHAMIFHYHGYTCFYCGRRFCRKALLKRHLSVHNGQKDFVCPVCDYATSHKSNLERHRKVHCRPDMDEKLEDEDQRLRMRDDDWREGEECNKLRDDSSSRAVSSDSGDESEEINVDSD